MKKGTKQETHERYEKFVNALLVLANKAEAARLVGYAPATAHVQAAKLLKNPVVLEILREKSIDRRLLGENLVRIERDVLTTAWREFQKAAQSNDQEKVLLFGEMIGRHFDRLRSIPGSGVELRARPDPEHSSPDNLLDIIEKIDFYIEGEVAVERPKLESHPNGNGAERSDNWKAAME